MKGIRSTLQNHCLVIFCFFDKNVDNRILVRDNVFDILAGNIYSYFYSNERIWMSFLSKIMIILGIDPGLALMGYGVISSKNDKIWLLECGTITTKADTPFPRRLAIIHKNIEELIEKYQPDCIAFEELFSGKNVKTVIQVAQARGAAMAAAFGTGAELFEYTPMQIKQAVVGYGRAEKKQVQEMVRVLLGLDMIIRPDDAADAVACAICHAHINRFSGTFRIR